MLAAKVGTGELGGEVPTLVDLTEVRPDRLGLTELDQAQVLRLRFDRGHRQDAIGGLDRRPVTVVAEQQLRQPTKDSERPTEWMTGDQIAVRTPDRYGRHRDATTAA